MSKRIIAPNGLTTRDERQSATSNDTTSGFTLKHGLPSSPYGKEIFTFSINRFKGGNQYQGGQGSSRKDSRKAGNGRKYCNLCNMKGHTADTCFEVIGYPDWYKRKKGNRGGKMATSAMNEDTPFDAQDGNNFGKIDRIKPTHKRMGSIVAFQVSFPRGQCSTFCN